MMRFAMAAAIPLRDDFDGPRLRALAKTSKDANQTRRLLSLAVIYEGGRRSEAAALGGVGLQIIRDWVLRFNAEGPDGLIDRKPPGASPKLNNAQRRALCAIVESGPIPAIHGVVRWRLKDLAQWLWEEFRVSLDESTVSRELKALGFVKISARPRHRAQNEFVREDFKKACPPRWQRSGRSCQPVPR
jgi:transposase